MHTTRGTRPCSQAMDMASKHKRLLSPTNTDREHGPCSQVMSRGACGHRSCARAVTKKHCRAMLFSNVGLEHGWCVPRSRVSGPCWCSTDQWEYSWNFPRHWHWRHSSKQPAAETFSRLIHPSITVHYCHWRALQRHMSSAVAVSMTSCQESYWWHGPRTRVNTGVTHVHGPWTGVANTGNVYWALDRVTK